MLQPLCVHTNRSAFKPINLKSFKQADLSQELAQTGMISDVNVAFGSSKNFISEYGTMDSLYLRVRPHKNAKYFVEISLDQNLSKKYGMKPNKIYRFKLQYPIYKKLQENKSYASIPIILVKRNSLFKTVLEPYKLKIDTEKLLG